MASVARVVVRRELLRAEAAVRLRGQVDDFVVFDIGGYPAADVTPAEILRFLMDQHGLTQGDLPKVGSQGVVSDILRGQRELNRRQIAGLKRRFDIGADAFV